MPKRPRKNGRDVQKKGNSSLDTYLHLKVELPARGELAPVRAEQKVRSRKPARRGWGI